jgi:phosphoesterase RecJ-like protein
MEYGPVIDFIGRNDRFIITTHETPDGDGLGSEMSMLLALRRLGKIAGILNADPAPLKFAYLDPGGEFAVLKTKGQIPKDIRKYALLILDVNDLNNIGQVATLVLPQVKEYFIIDHHDSETDLLSQNHIAQNASSTCEIVYLALRELGVDIDYSIAEALFTGIVYDTGSFVYPKTTALTFQIAHELVSRGVNPNSIYSKLYESNSISSLLLMSRVLNSLELHLDKRVAVQTMRRDLLEASSARYEEADQLINIPLRSDNIRVSVFFKENHEGLRRCSLRSKGEVDVAAIAQSFGGGGHKTAAGFKCIRSFEEVLEKIRSCFNGNDP